MATANPAIVLTGLARKLVDEGLINESVAERAIENARQDKVPLVSHLVKKNLVDARAIAVAASADFGIPVFDLEALDLEMAATKLVGEKLIRKHHSLPIFQRGQRLYVAVSDPTNFHGLDEIKFNVGLSTEAVLVEEDKLSRIIEKALEQQDEEIAGLDDFGDDNLDDLDLVSDEEENTADAASDAEIDDAPVVRYVNKLLLDAINKGASDLHFEPYEKRYRIRFRVDGILKEVAAAPIGMARKIAARIKVVSALDISEKRVPQDGRMKLKLGKRSIDFRVSTCPMLFGEKIVMRILDPSSAQLGIEMLGYEPDQRAIFEENLAKPYGMLLITGPTGSGKTVSLYTGINIINTPDINISTAEDPAEIVLEGVNQVNVNVKQGLTFASALKSFLRQDPDVILIGEIRDQETGEIAIKAAQTGHMVMATLHTNDAPQTITRLLNMGIPSYNIASALNLIIAQRLTRRLCKHCKKKIEVPEPALLEEGFTEEQIKEGITIYSAVGCDQCSEGYKGRAGIYQVMPISEAMALLIMSEATAIDLAKQAEKEGINDLRKSGLLKVIQGITTLDEINRVTQD
ncbi:MAG: type IV-A pilus assembly ATPase PilB [Gammaproteobacteria bacterium]|nr:MAG: type IV-A pilus assembly ATPase PilB [Gammaproteobacteria bacterium]RLA13970.1 MAG: type IV-A pilus assembly ATPase PilB [Gammaproteobacteria bacterium]